MFLHSQRAYGASEITITLVNSENKRSKVTVPANTDIQHLYQICYDRRSQQFTTATLVDYQRAINLSCQGIKLKNTESTLRACNISDGSIIRESFKKWVKAINVDNTALTITDPITLMPVVGKPYLLPDCNHALEKEPLAKWIEQRLRNAEEPNCPCCRKVISDEHIDKLVPVRPQPMRTTLLTTPLNQTLNALVADGVPPILVLMLLGAVIQMEEANIDNENEEDNGAGAAAPNLFGFFENSESSASTSSAIELSASDDEDEDEVENEESEQQNAPIASRKRKRDDDSNDDRPKPSH